MYFCGDEVCGLGVVWAVRSVRVEEVGGEFLGEVELSGAERSASEADEV